MLEATSSKHCQGELLGHQRRFPYFDVDETMRLPHCYPFILTLFKMNVVNKQKITLCNSSTALVFADVLSKHLHGSVFPCTE